MKRDLTERMARHRSGLAALSFAESTIVPIPLEAIVGPLMITHPRRAWRVALWIWVGCLIGASVFYAFGYWLAEPVVEPALEYFNLLDGYERVVARLEGQNLFWAVFLVSLTPAPMQLATLGAGAAGGNFVIYLAAIAASRGLRYFGLALLAALLGERLQQFNIPKKRIFAVTLVILLAVWGVGQLI